MTVMAVFQDVDKCMRCNGCVTACKREWNLKLPTNIADVKPAKQVVSYRQRLAIKSLKRGEMGPFMRYTCWHCPSPPCAPACPYGAIKKEATGAVSVDNTKCKPQECKTGPGPKPCQMACQRGGFPKVTPGLNPYESGPFSNTGTYPELMNKCTLCHGRAGADQATDPTSAVDPSTALPTRATLAEIALVPEKAHEPACVSSCPAKAMKWDSRANILAYLNDSANGYVFANGTKNWYGNGSMFWAAKKVLLIPPKADPFVEDHIAPMMSSMVTTGRMVLPTLVIGGLAALSARKNRIEEETGVMTGEEV